MTAPTQDQLDALPTTTPGAVYAILKRFGPWAIPTVLSTFIAWIIWAAFEKQIEKNSSIAESAIKSNFAMAESVKNMADELKRDREHTTASVNTMGTTIDELRDGVKSTGSLVRENAALLHESNIIIHQIDSKVDKIQIRQ